MIHPDAIPVTTPLDDPIVAIVILLVVHVPPDEASLIVVVVPSHIDDAPVMAAGVVLTVTVLVTKHPPVSV